MNLASLLRHASLTYGDRPAISVGTKVHQSYGELADRVPRLASGLANKLELKHGERVALVMKNCAAYFEAMFACWHAGLTVVPINAKLHPRELAFIISNSGSAACFATAELADAIEGVRDELPELRQLVSVDAAAYEALFSDTPMPMADVTPEDLAWLFYTSGTTGRPKGAMLTHRVLTSMIMNYYADVDGIEPQDCMIHCAPLSHGSGVYGLPHIARGANNVMPESGGFDVAETLDLIAHWPGATFFFAPTMVTRLINAEITASADTSNLKTIVYGGGPMYLEDLLKAMDLLGRDKFVQIYGQGEAPMTITGNPKRIFREADHPRYHERVGSTGLIRTDLEVKVVDEQGQELPTGEIGEVICRGDVVMVGYWANEEATAKSLKDGWLWTGDVGSFDEEGFLTLKDRSKDMIISGGTNIYPREVEEVLLRHPGVYECAVVGRPHADWGEEVIAFVVQADGSTVDEKELDQLCLDNIARFKRPKEYRFVTELAKNNYGKILKTELRNLMDAERA